MRKILIFAFIGAILIIFSLVVINATSDNVTGPGLQTIYRTNNRIIALSELAQKRASSYEIKVVATNTAITTTSNSTQINAYNTKRFGKPIKLKKLSKEQIAADPTVALSAKENGVDFDEQYKKSLKQELEANRNNIQNLFNESKSTSLKKILETVYDNNQRNLDQLNQIDSTDR